MHAWELLRELSHPARLDIVRGAAVQAKPVEALADQVNASVQETAMNLDRLGKLGLIDKNPDGTYRTAPMGQVVLWLLPAIDFLPYRPMDEVLEFARRVIDMFAPKLILGISDEISQVGQIEKVEAISKLVDEVCGLAS